MFMSGSQTEGDITEEEVQELLLDIARETFPDETELMITSTKSETVGWDSLGNLNLIMAVEDEFNVEFSEKELENSESIEFLYNTIIQKIYD